MALFIFLLVLAVIGIGAIIGSAFINKDEYLRWPWAAGGIALVIIAGGSILWSMSTTVGTSEVGIVTSFGHVDGGDLRPGVHFVAPWQNVTIWDDSVQRTAFEGKSCLEIRIAGQQSACLDVIVFWKDNPAGSDAQFRQYRTFPRVASAYFSRGIVTKFYNNVFEGFDPVTLTSLTPAGKTGGVTVSTLTAQVEANMRATYRGTAEIISLNSGQITYDPQVESALSSEVKAKANTNVAVQNEQTAADQRKADQSLTQNLTPSVVEQNCLNMTQQVLQAGASLPQGWTCTGGSGVGILAHG